MPFSPSSFPPIVLLGTKKVKSSDKSWELFCLQASRRAHSGMKLEKKIVFIWLLILMYVYFELNLHNIFHQIFLIIFRKFLVISDHCAAPYSKHLKLCCYNTTCSSAFHNSHITPQKLDQEDKSTVATRTTTGRTTIEKEKSYKKSGWPWSNGIDHWVGGIDNQQARQTN